MCALPDAKVFMAHRGQFVVVDSKELFSVCLLHLIGEAIQEVVHSFIGWSNRRIHSRENRQLGFINVLLCELSRLSPVYSFPKRLECFYGIGIPVRVKRENPTVGEFSTATISTPFSRISVCKNLAVIRRARILRLAWSGSAYGTVLTHSPM